MVSYLIRLLRYKKPLIGIYALAIIIASYFAIHLQFDHNRARFFPGQNDDLDFTNHFFDQLEQDDIYIFVAVENHNGILDSTFLNKVQSFQKACAKVPYIQKAFSVLNYNYPKKAGLSFYQVPVLHADKPNLYLSDSLQMYKREGLINNLVSEDFKALNIIVKTEVLNHQNKSDSAYYGVENLLKSYEFDAYHTAGMPVMQSVVIKTLASEMQFYVLLSFVLLIIVLIIIFRSFLGLIIPIFAVLGGLTFFFAYLYLSGQSLDLMATLYPVLMLIFCMSDVVHLQTHYIDELDKGKSAIEALKVSLTEIGLALFLTSLTTAVGFGTLVSSKVEAIRYFGFNAAIGVLIAYIIVLVFSSAGLLFFANGKLSKLKGQRSAWTKQMQALYVFNKQKWKLVLSVTLLVCFLAFYGISQISTNAFIKGDVPKDSKLSADFSFFEAHFNGVRTLEMAILPQSDYLVDEPVVLQEILKVEQHLKSHLDIKQVSSPILPYKVLHQAFAKNDTLLLPHRLADFKRYQSFIKADTNALLKNVMSDDKKLGRISARQKDLGSDIHMQQNKELEQWLAQTVDSNVVKLRITGTTLMYDKNHDYLRNSLFRTLGLAFIIVGLLFALLFSDWRMVFVSIIPNVIPLLIAAAAMGFLGIKLQALTSIFFAISFGIAVDDTIHFLTRFKLERKKGRTVSKAIEETLKLSGKAIILTSIILVFSFASLIFSDFSGTYYIGVLVSITLFSAVLADLFLLPQLLYFVNKEKIKKARKN